LLIKTFYSFVFLKKALYFKRFQQKRQFLELLQKNRINILIINKSVIKEIKAFYFCLKKFYRPKRQKRGIYDKKGYVGKD